MADAVPQPNEDTTVAVVGDLAPVMTNQEAADNIYKAILQTPYWNSWAYVVTDKEQAT